MRFGLALSGGGIRGAVHIGILQGLIENSLYPDIIASSSAGSIVGLLYSAGIPPTKMVSLVSQYESNIINEEYSTYALTLHKGLIKGDYIELALRTLTKGKNFNQLSPKLAVVTTNVVTGKGTVFTSTDLAKIKSKDYIFSGKKLSETILTSYANIIIEPKTGKVNFWEINKTIELVEIGKKAVYENLAALKKLLV